MSTSGRSSVYLEYLDKEWHFSSNNYFLINDNTGLKYSYDGDNGVVSFNINSKIKIIIEKKIIKVSFQNVESRITEFIFKNKDKFLKMIHEIETFVNLVIKEKVFEKESTTQFEEMIREKFGEFADSILLKKPEIGMNIEMLNFILGEPGDHKITETKNIKTEKLFYKPYSNNRNRIVYKLEIKLDNGVVSKIKEL